MAVLNRDTVGLGAEPGGSWWLVGARSYACISIWVLQYALLLFYHCRGGRPGARQIWKQSISCPGAATAQPD